MSDIVLKRLLFLLINYSLQILLYCRFWLPCFKYQ